ncbi:MAG: aldehyde dehydrogenase family protein [Myxococcales bacterium]|nr:aldehyde dehydrogenase family protein [Myxococcales bacterium]
MSKELLAFATLDPKTLSGKEPVQLCNLVDGEWRPSRVNSDIPDPLNGEIFIKMPNTKSDEIQPFLDSLAKCPKSGLHNPLKNVERYRLYGDVSAKAAAALRDPEVFDFFTRCVQRVMPKSYAQAMGEVTVLRIFLENFSGDQVRFLARGFSNPGDYVGQQSHGYRWPYGPVIIVSPFNFPLEIPALQLMGALYMGNKVLIKNASTTSMVIEQFVRLLHQCGMPKEDVDMIHCGGRVMGEIIEKSAARSLQFTGSAHVAEQLAIATKGKLFIEDAGFDWKILGPDHTPEMMEYVAWQCDQDAYASSGQKCSAQSILFAHQNWVDAGLFDRLHDLAARRNVEDLTLGPILSVTNEEMDAQRDKLLKIPGAKVLFGGEHLTGYPFPAIYGSYKPTAIYVPLPEILKHENFDTVCTEIFAPFQVVTSWDDSQLPLVLEVCERMDLHLTAAIVSNDPLFVREVLAHTVNGTTYTGLRARTTGAPQNHWFGPAGDPRGAGIGTAEAIKLVWSCHREIIQDLGPIPQGWTTPKAS